MKKILLIEDNAGDVFLIRQALAEAPTPMGISVAIDGQQALQLLSNREFQPNLIILDLNDPKIPGIALLEQCKPAAPVVVFTSSANPAEMQRASARISFNSSSCGSPG
jgi:chemotaxis family two-component system response regulator Rcp1